MFTRSSRDHGAADQRGERESLDYYPFLRGILGRNRPLTQGAGPVVLWCAAETPLASGAYYEQSAIGTPSPLVDNDGALGRLWQLSATLAGLDRAHVSTSA